MVSHIDWKYHLGLWKSVVFEFPKVIKKKAKTTKKK